MTVKNLRCNQRAKELLLNCRCWLEQRQDLELNLFKFVSKDSLRPKKEVMFDHFKNLAKDKGSGSALSLTCHVKQSLRSSFSSFTHQSLPVPQPHSYMQRAHQALPLATVVAETVRSYPSGTQLSNITDLFWLWLHAYLLLLSCLFLQTQTLKNAAVLDSHFSFWSSCVLTT